MAFKFHFCFDLLRPWVIPVGFRASLSPPSPTPGMRTPAFCLLWAVLAAEETGTGHHHPRSAPAPPSGLASPALGTCRTLGKFWER